VVRFDTLPPDAIGVLKKLTIAARTSKGVKMSAANVLGDFNKIRAGIVTAAADMEGPLFRECLAAATAMIEVQGHKVSSSGLAALEAGKSVLDEMKEIDGLGADIDAQLAAPASWEAFQRLGVRRSRLEAAMTSLGDESIKGNLEKVCGDAAMKFDLAVRSRVHSSKAAVRKELAALTPIMGGVVGGGMWNEGLSDDADLAEITAQLQSRTNGFVWKHLLAAAASCEAAIKAFEEASKIIGKPLDHTQLTELMKVPLAARTVKCESVIIMRINTEKNHDVLRNYVRSELQALRAAGVDEPKERMSAAVWKVIRNALSSR
jgi:hypothetical protein